MIPVYPVIIQQMVPFPGGDGGNNLPILCNLISPSKFKVEPTCFGD